MSSCRLRVAEACPNRIDESKIKDPYPPPLPRDSGGYVNNIDLTPKPFHQSLSQDIKDRWQWYKERYIRGMKK